MPAFRPARALIAVLLALPLAAGAIPVEGHKLLISAPNAFAVEVGRKVYAEGGNVIDVAVAVGLTLSVTAPYFAALGGGGFALVKMKPEEGARALDFRETAPRATGRDYYLKLGKNASTDGGTAVAVPGFPAGLWELHQKYGKLKWAALFREPIRLARQGFPVSGEWAAKTRENLARFNAAGTRHFAKPDKSPLVPGETLRQPALARALEALRDRGPRGFYAGAVARDVVQGATEAGGTLGLDDLKAYKTRWLKPLSVAYAGHVVDLMPPPSSGGVVIYSALKLIEGLKVKDTRELGADEYHLLAEVEKRAFRGRALLGDPDFHRNPVSFLTSDGYLEELRKSVNPKKTAALKALTASELPKESNETTHFSVMDTEGHAIALTVTLNGSYGSGVVSPAFGIALNNEMDDFTTRPGEANMYGLVQGPGNDVEAGKRPLSSMSPTLVEKDGKVVMTLGAPGGPRIITGVLQALYRILGRGMDADSAVQAPRVHHQFLPDTLYVDQRRLAPEVLDALKARGHRIEESWMAKVYVVRLRPDGLLEAAYDSRGEGAAGGF